MTNKTNKSWIHYEPLIKALVDLFHPFLEVAVHDLKKGEIVAIYHNISHRKIGEKSPLNELKIDSRDFPDYFAPYYKKNWDGRPLKCTSITLRDPKGKAIGLICFNVDTNSAHETQQLLQMFLKTKEESENPIEKFGSDCEEQTSQLLNEYLKNKNLSLNHITNKQKQEVVHHLHQKGIFNYKNASPYVAELLSISRATVYNYIKKMGGSS